MAVGSVFTEAHIGNDIEIWETGFEETNGLDDGALRIVGGGTEGIFGVGNEGDAEEDYRPESFGNERGKVGDQFGDTTAMLVRQRGNRAFFVGIVGNKERVDEHRLMRKVLVSKGR